MSTAIMPTAPDAVRGGKYLTFFLAEEEYGVAILRVQEIIGLQAITRVPRTPSFIRGVINLRGKVIPVVDLRERFGMRPVDLDAGGDATQAARAAALRCIVILEVTMPDEAGPGVARMPMGVVVDRVSEVAAIDAASVEDPPCFGATVRTEFLLGVASRGERVRLLLDIDRVLARDEVREVARATA